VDSVDFQVGFPAGACSLASLGNPRIVTLDTSGNTLAPSHPRTLEPSHPGTPRPWTAVNWGPSNHQPHGQEAGARPHLAWRERGCDGMARGELWQARCVAADTAGHERALRWRAAGVVTKRIGCLRPKMMELGGLPTANPATLTVPGYAVGDLMMHLSNRSDPKARPCQINCQYSSSNSHRLIVPFGGGWLGKLRSNPSYHHMNRRPQSKLDKTRRTNKLEPQWAAIFPAPSISGAVCPGLSTQRYSTTVQRRQRQARPNRVDVFSPVGARSIPLDNNHHGHCRGHRLWWH
jgi:hypothetical protein